MEALGNATPLRYGLQMSSGLAEDLFRPSLCANMFAPEMLDDDLTCHAPIGAFDQRFFLAE